MHALGRSNNLAARSARWSARHWKSATLGWLAFVAVATVLGGMVGTKELSDTGGMNGDSARAERIMDGAGFPDGSYEVVLVQSATTKAQSGAFKRAVGDVVAALARTQGVEEVRSPYANGNEDQISKDGRSAVIELRLDGDRGEKYDGVERALAAVAAVQRAHPAFRIEETGGPSIDRAVDETSGKDFKRAELSSIPLTIGILLVAFGALLAAFLPVVLALTAFFGATGVLAFASQLLPVDNAASSVMLLIGLAVGVDYSLFYLKREREERALGKSREAALEAAAATSGHSVLISGLTVIVAMAGMFLAGNDSFVGVGLGTVIVVAIAIVGSLTVLPALLSRLGDKVELGRIPGLHRVRAGGESRLWAPLLDRVLRRPATAAVLSGGLLLALAVPALGLHTATPGADDLPQRLAAVQTLNRIEAAFPGVPGPAAVVIRANHVTAPRIKTAIAHLQERALRSGAAHTPIDVDLNPAKTVAVVSIPLAGDGAGDARSEQALATLRKIVHSTIDPSGADAVVGGEVAASRDFNAALKSHMPLVFAFVLGLAFVLLLVAFRSLVIALTAILLNLLSVTAAYGLLVIVFQHGLGESLLDFTSTGSIVAWLPLFLFVVLFGLSMDYHVFILSRIREARDRGLATDDAIAHGIKSTAGVVTAAATVMVFVFAIFATLSQLSLKQLGVGLAAAVLIDATLIRGVLLPATMKLLGEANWYLPRRLFISRKAAAVTAVVLAGVATLTGAASASSASRKSPSLNHEARALLRTGIPGAVLLAGRPGSLVRVAVGSDLAATQRPMLAGDRFRVGSITKTFVATLVLQLVAEHRLSLDDTVERWLPGIVPGGEAISVRQLLRHQSGLFDYAADPATFRPFATDPGHSWQPRRLVAIATAHAPLFPPGAGWGYSNTNYVLLGLIVEAATGQPVAHELEQHIFRPLHLWATSFDTDGRFRDRSSGGKTARFAHGYSAISGRRLDATDLNPSWGYAAGAVTSTAGDLATFYAALMRGELFGRHSLKEMTRVVSLGHGLAYGLGLQRTATRCGSFWGHDGGTFGYTSNAFVSGDGREVAILLANSGQLTPAQHEAFMRLAEDAACAAKQDGA